MSCPDGTSQLAALPLVFGLVAMLTLLWIGKATASRVELTLTELAATVATAIIRLDEATKFIEGLSSRELDFLDKSCDGGVAEEVNEEVKKEV